MMVTRQRSCCGIATSSAGRPTARTMLAVAIFLVLQVLPSCAFGPSAMHSRHSSHTVTIHASNRDSDGNEDSNNKNNAKSLFASLRARQEELSMQTQELEQKWRNADCQSGIRVGLPDWIRRIDVEYPLVAAGSSQGHVYVGHLETGTVIATNRPVEEEPETENQKKKISPTTTGASAALPSPGDAPADLERTLQAMYGPHDGGGTLAIAFSGNLICVANREGSVDLWRLDVATKQLVAQGSMQALQGRLVTALELSEDSLWVGTSNGAILGFGLDEGNLPLAVQPKAQVELQALSTILALSIHSELGCGVATTSSGSVEVFSLEPPNIRSRPRPNGNKSLGMLASLFPPFDPRQQQQQSPAPRRSSTPVVASTATIIEHALQQKSKNSEENGDQALRPDNTGYSVLIGGSDGSLWQQPLKLTEDGDVDEQRPFVEPLKQLRPPHLGAVKCLVSPVPNLIVSGALDGSVRVTDILTGESLYQFVGFKVWLGSMWTDGRRLVSDGCDNGIMMHDFMTDHDNGTV